jgi:replication factor C small subunit
MEIWIEKYRPKKFEDMIGQKPIVKRIKAFVEKKSVPHLLFVGPAGTGKTSLILVAVKQLYGSSWKDNFLELNASDERGIDVVRNTIKDFARTKPIGNVSFKIIYLDECDSLTKEAQQALRRTMENYASVTRFCLSGNYSSKIIDPIQSRCTIFRFKPLEKEDIFELIDNVCEKENLKVKGKVKEILFEVSNGDVRRLLNIMQSCASISTEITDNLVYDIVSEARPKEVRKIIESAVKGDFLKSKNILLDVMLKYGLSGLDVIRQIQSEVLDLDLDELKKLKLIEKCGEIEFRMVEGSDEFVQLQALLAGFYLGD